MHLFSLAGLLFIFKKKNIPSLYDKDVNTENFKKVLASCTHARTHINQNIPPKLLTCAKSYKERMDCCLYVNNTDVAEAINYLVVSQICYYFLL